MTTLVTVPKNVKFYHKGVKPVSYKANQKVETDDKEFIAWCSDPKNGHDYAKPAAPLSLKPKV